MDYRYYNRPKHTHHSKNTISAPKPIETHKALQTLKQTKICLDLSSYSGHDDGA